MSFLLFLYFLLVLWRVHLQLITKLKYLGSSTMTMFIMFIVPSLLTYFSISTHFITVNLWYKIMYVKLTLPFSTVGGLFWKCRLTGKKKLLLCSLPFFKVLLLNHHYPCPAKHLQKTWDIFQNLCHSTLCNGYRMKVFKGVFPFYPCRQSYQAAGVGDCLRQQLGSRLAWTLTASQPSLQSTTSKGFPNAVSRGVPRSRREGDTSGEQRCIC